MHVGHLGPNLDLYQKGPSIIDTDDLFAASKQTRVSRRTNFSSIKHSGLEFTHYILGHSYIVCTYVTINKKCTAEPSKPIDAASHIPTAELLPSLVHLQCVQDALLKKTLCHLYVNVKE